MTKRGFLQSVGAGVPTLRRMLAAARPEAAAPSGKFTMIDCSKHWTAATSDLGARERKALVNAPAGRQDFRGIPFALGPEGAGAKRWLALSTRKGPWLAESAEIPVAGKATYLCLAQFSDFDENEQPKPGSAAMEKVGQHLADAVITYEDGTSHTHPVRRRFEVTSLTVPWGHLCFAAVPHRKDVPSKATDPLRNALDWGNLQLGVWEPNYPVDPGLKCDGTLWVCAIENPHPERAVRALRIQAKSEDVLIVAGVTAYHGRENPLRHERLALYRITLPEGETSGKWEVSVDLGIVARTYRLPAFNAGAWLASPAKGFAERSHPENKQFLYAEVSASADATLTLRNKASGAVFAFDLGKATPETELEANRPGARVAVLEREKTWIHGSVTDTATGKAAPVRLAFRSADGRYIPPYGHRTEVNAGWFQDYGADVNWAESSYAYVDGTFQVELPVGEVFVEITKGFEYTPVRERLKIEAGQKELNLEIARFTDLRSKNWVTADTHVHFLSPSTAILEAQAEGLNLINLLAAQWGDLFTNVGDLAHGPLTSKDGDTVVWVGTENRQHLLGHLGLLGGRGEPVFPMGASGPEESYIGAPLWNNLADWADACRKREGLVVAVHFPYPTAELAADIALGKIDAVELWPVDMGEQFNNLRFQEWYRYLNCGYRLPAVAGTDKMGAWIPAGAYRAYAWLDQDEFSFANWAKAVRRGNTFMSSGPLLFLEADGKAPGEEIALGAGGGRIEVRARVESAVPVHRLEIVWNGVVTASREQSGDGARELTLQEALPVSGPGWLAARCASRLGQGWSQIAAHTSPLYVVAPGQELFSAPVAAYMLTLIDGAETWAKHIATRPDAERYARALKVFQDARDELHRRMHAHGVKH